MKFFEDLELDYSFRTFNKEFSFANSESNSHRITRFNSIEDSQNIKIDDLNENFNTNDYKPVIEEECSRKDFEGLKTENPINLNFLQTAETPSTKTPRSPMWQLEDYFII